MVPATDVIRMIQEATPYRFLYRDALISGVRVELDSHAPDMLAEFNKALRKGGLFLQIDHDRHVVFVLPLLADHMDNASVIRGTVSDARSLERLPHATLAWNGPRGLGGVVTDEAGRFLITVAPAQEHITLVTSFLGYAPDTLLFAGHNLPGDVAIKLEPRVVLGSEVVVSCPLLSSNLDSTWYHLLGASLATPAGDQSITRALQMLPAVGLTTAVSSGLNVRGSRTDGFQILLDGIPIYNQSHLFGMFDAFAPDVLQAVDFYYGVAPARFQAPPGGTLSFMTRAGSKQSLSARVGITTTSASITAEGPLNAGKGSWIFSGRRSYLDRIDWFNNDGLIAMGLGVDRENSGTRRLPLDERTLVAGAPSARFFDAHAKLETESASGATLQISAYVGGDKTMQDGQRVIALSPERPDPRIRSDVVTANDWGNAAFSLHYRGAVRANGYSHTYVGLTRYHSSFRKDDFFYRAPPAAGTQPQLLFAPFLNDNALTEGRLVHESMLALSPTLETSFGFSVQRLVVTYDELSALRREFRANQRAWEIDAFGEFSHRGRILSATFGLRPHYFSLGNYLRLSPRFTVLAFGSSPLSFSAGYTRNYQFVHRLYVENATSSDIWVLTSAREPPGAVDHITASALYRMGQLTAQLAGFLKWQQNLRRHETLLRPGVLPDGAVLLSPWTHDNESRATGIEALLSRRFGAAQFAATYTLSRVEIRHPSVNGGHYFFADWDRPHQFSANAQLILFSNLTATLVWTIASGQPNAFASIDAAEPPRYPTYRRLDASIQLRHPVQGAYLEAVLRIYNLLDTQNVWYRTAETVLAGRGQNIRLAFEPIDVYDLGIQPSLGFALKF